MILRQHLKAITERAQRMTDPQHLAVIRRAVADLKSRGIELGVAKAGERVSEFVLPDARGRPVSLMERMARGAIVLNFYRGGWCPYCCAELRALQLALPRFTAHGVSLIAISPELPDNSLSLAEREALDFDILTDMGNVVARSYGLVFRVPDDLQKLLLAKGVDLPALNGEESWELPMPATFLIGANGIIRLAFADADHTERLDPQVILDLLDQTN